MSTYIMGQRERKSNPPPRRRTPDGTGERLVSVAEAARRIGVSPRQVGRYIDGGHLAYGVLPGGRKMPTERAVDRFIALAIEGRL